MQRGGQQIRFGVILLALATAAVLRAKGTEVPAATAPDSRPAPSHHPSVTLTWKPSPTPHMMGYNIYRSAAPPCATETKTGKTKRREPRHARPPACEMKLLNPTPVAKPEYEDRDVERGKTYYYQVRAVAANGATSAPSNLATAPIPDAPQAR